MLFERYSFWIVFFQSFFSVARRFCRSFEVRFVEHVSKGSGSAEIFETSVPLARNEGIRDP